MENDTRSASTSEPPSSDGQFESFLAALAASPPPYKPPSLIPGEVFADRYRIERELGRGGMGAVHLATDLELGRKVALKFAAGRRADAELVRLQQEAQVMAGLSHPGIVTVFEAAAAGDDVYISLEFVPGGTLRDWMDLGRRPWREVVAMFLPLAQTLAAAHTAGVIHRDFKPQNVLLSLEGEPRIADFGLARSVAARETLEAPLLAHVTITGPGTRTGAVLGTPAYMAPEQALGLAATAAADQFSFFVTLYEAIAGKRPFPGKTMAAVLEAIDSGPPRSAPGMPSALADVIRRGLRSTPDARHPDMDAVAAALEHVLHARRRRIRTVVLVAGTLVASGVGFVVAPGAVEPCQPEVLAASVQATWDEATRRSVSERAGSSAVDTLGAYAEGIAETRLQSCRAHAIAQTLSDADFALRSACLDRAEARFSGLVDDIAAHGLPGVDPRPLLQDVAQCEDTVALRRYEGSLASVSRFETTAQDSANREGFRLIALAESMQRRGEDPVELAEQARFLARQHGLHAIEAEALVLLAAAGDDPMTASARLDEAEAVTRDALPVSVLVGIAVQRANLALQMGKVELAAAHVAHAQAVARLDVGGVTERSRLTLDLVREQVNLATGNTATTVETLLRIADVLPSDDATGLFARSLLADAYVDRLQLTEADRAYARALEHPNTAAPATRGPLLVNRASALVYAGKPDAALASLRALDEAFPDGAPPYLEAPALTVRAGALRLQGQLEEAREHADAALASFRTQSPAHPSIPNVLDELARIELDLGRWRPAFDQSQAALDAWTALGEAAGPDAARTLVSMSHALRALGHADKAAGAARASLEILEAHRRPAAELAVSALALAKAQGTQNPDAQAACATSDLAQCRDAVR